jgi:hypothetical protein
MKISLALASALILGLSGATAHANGPTGNRSATSIVGGPSSHGANAPSQNVRTMSSPRPGANAGAASVGGAHPNAAILPHTNSILPHTNTVTAHTNANANTNGKVVSSPAGKTGASTGMNAGVSANAIGGPARGGRVSANRSGGSGGGGGNSSDSSGAGGGANGGSGNGGSAGAGALTN